MQGAMFVIDQLGQTIMLRDQQIAQLSEQVKQLQAELATKGSASDGEGQGSGNG